MKSSWRPTTKKIVYDEKKLYNYGINRLSVREYARQELMTKMVRFQEDTEMVNKVLDKLVEQGYLSDERRTLSMLNQYAGRESIYKIKNRMQQKGLDKDFIQDIIEEKNSNSSEGEELVATELLHKKFKSLDIVMKDKQKNSEKMIRFLASKGFKYDIIKKAMTAYFSEK